MNVRDAAARGNVSERTIWRWLASGRLCSTREPLEHSSYRHEISLEALVHALDAKPARWRSEPA